MSTEPIPIEIQPSDISVALRAAELVARARASRDLRAWRIHAGCQRRPHARTDVRRPRAPPGLPLGANGHLPSRRAHRPDGDPNRNLTLLWDNLHRRRVSRLHPMPVTAEDLDIAADAYAAALPERFDLIHLGIGADGHTASLVPGDPVLDVLDRDVALTAEYMGLPRMTFTYPLLNSARALLWLITGEAKRDALARLRAGDESVPAGRISRGQAQIVADAAAAR